MTIFKPLKFKCFYQRNFVKQFEDNFKKYSNVEHNWCIKRMDALMIAMESLNLKGEV